MNSNNPTGLTIRIAKCLGFILVLMLAFSACKQKTQSVTKTQNPFYYTCSMHPQVHLDHPGNCPICGMKLIRVEITAAPNAAAMSKLTLTAAQLQLAGIQTDTVKEQNTGNEKTLTGTVTIDQNHTEQLSSRLSGRIQRLYVRTVGEKIAPGQAIYTLYSEDLQEAEKEYLLAKQQQKVLNNPDVDYKQLISAAENKLLLWGLTPLQVKNLASANKVSPVVTIYSKTGGTLSEINVHEGDYVTEGMPVLKTQALNTLWVEAQLYTGEAAMYKEGNPVQVSFPDLGGLTIGGKVAFINPELANASKVDLVRIVIPNPQNNIRPGMLAYISIATAKQRTLAVPASAIITDGKGDKVWVRNTDGSFSGMRIQTGPGNQSYVPVISGLNKGDVVVTNGAYLLNSEAIFKNGDKQMDMKM